MYSAALLRCARNDAMCGIKVPEAALSTAQEEEIEHRVTAMFVAYFSEAARPHTMVPIEEVPDGGYGRADECS